MTDIERLCLAEKEFGYCRDPETFVVAFNRFLAENYGVKYLWPCNPWDNSWDNCIEVIDPKLYTFYLLKWP